MRTATLILLIAFLLSLVGCGTATQNVPQKQAAGTTVYQIQINPYFSENARPVHAGESPGEPERMAGGPDGSADWRDANVHVTITTNSETADTGQTGTAEGAEAAPTTDVSPEIDVTP